MDRATFRAAFPEFASVDVYPDAQVGFWLGQADLQLDRGLWAELWDQGAALLTAHNLTLARAAARSAAAGGAGAGLVASKAVGGASVSYDTGATTLEGGGAYNLTAYGTRFLQLARMVGLGGIQF